MPRRARQRRRAKRRVLPRAAEACPPAAPSAGSAPTAAAAACAGSSRCRRRGAWSSAVLPGGVDRRRRGRRRCPGAERSGSAGDQRPVPAGPRRARSLPAGRSRCRHRAGGSEISTAGRAGMLVADVGADRSREARRRLVRPTRRRRRAARRRSAAAPRPRRRRVVAGFVAQPELERDRCPARGHRAVGERGDVAAGGELDAGVVAGGAGDPPEGAADRAGGPWSGLLQERSKSLTRRQPSPPASASGAGMAPAALLSIRIVRCGRQPTLPAKSVSAVDQLVRAVAEVRRWRSSAPRRRRCRRAASASPATRRRSTPSRRGTR